MSKTKLIELVDKYCLGYDIDIERCIMELYCNEGVYYNRTKTWSMIAAYKKGDIILLKNILKSI